MTSPRPSPHAPGAARLRAARGHPGRLRQSRSGEDTDRQTHKEAGMHRRRTHGHAAREHLQRDSGDAPRRTQEETTGRLTPTHTYKRIHMDTHILADAQPSVHTPGRFQVQISAGEGSRLWARGGHYDPPSSGIFPDPARDAER